MKGTVKAITPTNVVSGLQVWHPQYGILNAGHEREDYVKTGNIDLMEFTEKDSKHIASCKREDVRVLVIEYQTQQNELRQMGLKRSQWKSALEYKEVDTGKEVQFEIIEMKKKQTDKFVRVAKIVPMGAQKNFNIHDLIDILDDYRITLSDRPYLMPNDFLKEQGLLK